MKKHFHKFDDNNTVCRIHKHDTNTKNISKPRNAAICKATQMRNTLALYFTGKIGKKKSALDFFSICCTIYMSNTPSVNCTLCNHTNVIFPEKSHTVDALKFNHTRRRFEKRA